MNIRMFTAAAMTLAFATSATASEALMTPTPNSSTKTATEQALETLQLAQTATCLANGKRYSKGARLCMGGFWNYCNSRGLWEPSNQKC